MRQDKLISHIGHISGKLKTQGYQLKLIHEPLYRRQHTRTCQSIGRTTVEIKGNGHNVLGSSYCSEKDKWDEICGAQVAFNRAFHEFSRLLGRDTVKEILKG